jgi:DNA-binding MarR family transcriptional regulator
MNDPAVRVVQQCYPQIYFACHVDHVRKGSTRYRLSAHDSGILSHLSETEPTTPGELTRHVGVAASTFSPQLERLVRLGYVHRTRAGDDRRRWEIRLSTRGAKAISATSVLDARRVKAVLRRLSSVEQARALEGLALLARASRQMKRRGA